MIKRILCTLLSVMCLLCGIPTYADDAQPELHIYFNDQELSFDKKPYLSDGTIMCELSTVFDAIGIPYEYNAVSENVKAKYRNTYEFEAKIGDNTLIFDEVKVEAGAPLRKDGNKIIMPLDTICYGYNILIDRSDLSHIVLSEKPKPELKDVNGEIAEILSSFEGEHLKLFEEKGGFLEDSIHENKDGDTVWWEENEVNVEGQEFDKALDIKVVNKPSTYYAKQIKATVDKPTKADSKAVISFWGKSISAQNDSGFIKLNFVYERFADWYKFISSDIDLSNEWKKYYLVGDLATDMEANSCQIGVRFCHAYGEFQIADMQVEVIDTGGKEIDLPYPPSSYRGYEDDAIWRKEAQKRIEKYRKNDINISVTDKDGNPVKDAEVTAKMTDSEMHWGAQIWGSDVRGGSATATGFSKETEWKLNLLKENGFNTFVIGNENKPPGYTPEQIQNMINWCIDNNFNYRLHAFAWDYPNTANAGFKKFNDNPNNRGYTSEATMRKRLENQINTMGSFETGYPMEIDVFNEVSSYWDTMLDPQYSMGIDEVARAFDIAKELCPDSTLILNEATIGANNPSTGRTRPFLALLKYLNSIGCKYDGLGMQGHAGGADYPNHWYENAELLSQYTDYIAVTEYDSTMVNQNDMYNYFRDVLIACYSHPNIKTFTIWTPFWVGNSSTRLEVLCGKNDAYFLPGFYAWQDMVMKEWRTNETVKTDENGLAKIRGHRGKYEVAVTAGGKSKTISMQLTTDEEKDKITVVVGDDITINCDNKITANEKKKYIDYRDSGKLTEMNMPKIERAYEPKTTILGAVDSNGTEVPEIFDSNDDTLWVSENSNDYITVELRDNVALNKLDIKWGNGYIKRFNNKVEISEDGESWTTVKSGINDNVNQTIDLGGKSAKFIRISAVDGELQIRDINVYVKQ